MKSFLLSTVHIGAGRGVCLPQSSFIAAIRENNKQYLLCPDFFKSMTLLDGPDKTEYSEEDFARIYMDALEKSDGETEKNNGKVAEMKEERVTEKENDVTKKDINDERKTNQERVTVMEIEREENGGNVVIIDKNDFIHSNIVKIKNAEKKYDENNYSLDLSSTPLFIPLVSSSSSSSSSSTSQFNIIRAEALLKYEIVPVRRRGLVAFDPLGERERRTLDLAPVHKEKESFDDKKRKIVEITNTDTVNDNNDDDSNKNSSNNNNNNNTNNNNNIINNNNNNNDNNNKNNNSNINKRFDLQKPKKVCTPTDPELIDFWREMKGNTKIRESVNYAHLVRKLALSAQENKNEIRCNKNKQISDNSNNKNNDNDDNDINNNNINNNINNNDNDNNDENNNSKNNINDKNNNRKEKEFLYGFPKLSEYRKSDHNFNGKISEIAIRPITDTNYTKIVNTEIENTIIEEVSMHNDEKQTEIETTERKEKEKIDEINERYDFSNDQADLLNLSGKLGASVTFLGTACAIPSKYRNVSGILIHLPLPPSLPRPVSDSLSIPISFSDSDNNNNNQRKILGNISSLASFLPSTATATTANNTSTITSKNENDINNKYINVSEHASERASTYYKKGKSTMLLDAGEGTWQQLMRMAHHTTSTVGDEEHSASGREDSLTKYYGNDDDKKEKEKKIENKDKNKNGSESENENENNEYHQSVEEVAAENLKLIWISHPHADHHLGLLMILSERKRILTRMYEKRKKIKRRILEEMNGKNDNNFNNNDNIETNDNSTGHNDINNKDNNTYYNDISDTDTNRNIKNSNNDHTNDNNNNHNNYNNNNNNNNDISININKSSN